MDTDPNNLTSKEINPLISIDKCEDEVWQNHLVPKTIVAGKETEENSNYISFQHQQVFINEKVTFY